MTHVRVARIVALSIAAALVIGPVGAYADDVTDPAVPVMPVVTPTQADPVAVAPRPAPVIVVRAYRTSAERLLVGSAFDLTINVYNATARRADNVVVSLGQSSGTGAAAAAATAGGLTVLGTGNAKYLGALKGKTEDAVTFQVIAGPGTAPGALTVPVTVSFEHEGARQEVAYTIGLLLERNAVLQLVAAELPETVMQGDTFDASFEVANASGFALAGVALSVEASGAAVTDSTVFVGAMDSAATEAIDVSITPESAGPLEVVVIVSYRDDFGRPQSFRESRTVIVDAVPDGGAEGPDAEAPEGEKGDDNWFVAFIKSLFGLGS